MIDTALRQRLVDAGTSAGSRVYPKILPQNPTYPALTYEIVDDPRRMTHGGPNGLVEARYTIIAWSPVPDDMRALVDEVRGVLLGYTGPMGDVTVSRIAYEGGPDMFEPDVGPQGRSGVHWGPRDYVIQYTE